MLRGSILDPKRGPSRERELKLHLNLSLQWLSSLDSETLVPTAQAVGTWSSFSIDQVFSCAKDDGALRSEIGNLYFEAIVKIGVVTGVPEGPLSGQGPTTSDPSGIRAVTIDFPLPVIDAIIEALAFVNGKEMMEVVCYIVSMASPHVHIEHAKQVPSLSKVFTHSTWSITQDEICHYWTLRGSIDAAHAQLLPPCLRNKGSVRPLHGELTMPSLHVDT